MISMTLQARLKCIKQIINSEAHNYSHSPCPNSKPEPLLCIRVRQGRIAVTESEMSTQNRHQSFSSSTMSSLAKRQAPSSVLENAGNAAAVVPQLGKKRAPLGDITNHKNVPQKGSRISLPSSNLVPCSSKIAKVKKGTPTGNKRTDFNGDSVPVITTVKSSALTACKPTPFPRSEEHFPSIALLSARCDMDVSPSKSDGISISFDETMSTCDSFKSPEIEYIDNTSESPVVDSINKKTLSKLHISEHEETAESMCTRDIPGETCTDNEIVQLDSNYQHPQLCATIACDIYKHLRASETKKRPSSDFMETIQIDINPSMRAILIDWLVEVAEEYRLVPDTLYLTVNYIDRYLSGNKMNRQKLQLLGVACMMIAAKYEEICAPQVEEFCYITDNTYFRDEVLEMESAVLNYLKFETMAPTAKCFLRRFVRAAHGINEVPTMQLECMANYITELSLLEYSMLCYAPSLTAAAAIFLAKYILLPSKRPWTRTLQHYTLYQPSDLSDCVKHLHRLCCNTHSSTLSAIREKYSQHKYKFVAKKCCPPSIPQEFFNNRSH